MLNRHLSGAAYNGHLAIVEELLNSGAEINSQDKYGDTALTSVARCGHTEIIYALLRSGSHSCQKGTNLKLSTLITDHSAQCF